MGRGTVRRCVGRALGILNAAVGFVIGGLLLLGWIDTIHMARGPLLLYDGLFFRTVTVERMIRKSHDSKAICATRFTYRTLFLCYVLCLYASSIESSLASAATRLGPTSVQRAARLCSCRGLLVVAGELEEGLGGCCCVVWCGLGMVSKVDRLEDRDDRIEQ